MSRSTSQQSSGEMECITGHPYRAVTILTTSCDGCPVHCETSSNIRLSNRSLPLQSLPIKMLGRISCQIAIDPIHTTMATRASYHRSNKALDSVILIVAIVDLGCHNNSMFGYIRINNLQVVSKLRSCELNQSRWHLRHVKKRNNTTIRLISSIIRRRHAPKGEILLLPSACNDSFKCQSTGNAKQGYSNKNE